MAQFDISSLIGLLVVFVFLSQAIRIVREYERVVIFRLGRFSGVKGPGIFFIIPYVDRVRPLTVAKTRWRPLIIDAGFSKTPKIDHELVLLSIPGKEGTSGDNLDGRTDA